MAAATSSRPHGITVWFTGLPSAGRTTVANLVAEGLAELGIQPLRYEHAFFCRRCEAMATSRTCPHRAETRAHLSGTAVRDLLARGQLPPPQFSRPEVAQLLADGYRTRGG